MHRCIGLARQAAGYVAPNPMVGAVLVNNGEIIGEGWHKQYGGPHAEVNCIGSVLPEKKHLVFSSTLYVSLEPCAHFGKTPPCADLLIHHHIPDVYIGCRDPFSEVNGRGIEKLLAAGIAVKTGILEKECVELNKRFFTFHTKQRPYIVLKWAQTANAIIGNHGNNRLHITGELTNNLVHKWRSEEAAVMVGTKTALTDNPRLTNRYYNGPQPVRVVIDKQLTLPSSLHVLDGSTKTIVFNTVRQQEAGNILYCQLEPSENFAEQMLHAFYKLKISSVLIEGGAKLIQSFINAGLWDEARVITNAELFVAEGVKAPVLSRATKLHAETIKKDSIRYYFNIEPV